MILTERSHADAVMHATAQRLCSMGSFSWRPSTNEIIWSAEVDRIFAFDTALPPSLELMVSRVHAGDLARFHEMIDRDRRDSRMEYEHRLSMPDGSLKYVRFVALASRTEDDQLEYVGAIQDVTQRRLSELTLDKVRSEFARLARVASLGAQTASIAHEVAQPLSGIITNASTCLRMLALDPPNIQGARKTAQRTLRDGRRAHDVIARTRSFIAKKAEAHDSVNLNAVVREVAAMLSSELQRCGTIPRLELAEHLPPVIGDKVQLQQVIINLLLNASEAMRDIDDRPRRLVIATKQEQSNACLSVQDSGVGIKDQDIVGMFEAFYTTKSDGIGIGLSVSRSIIESHHGRLWAESNEGPGATFSFCIPCDLPTSRN